MRYHYDRYLKTPTADQHNTEGKCPASTSCTTEIVRYRRLAPFCSMASSVQKISIFRPRQSRTTQKPKRRPFYYYVADFSVVWKNITIFIIVNCLFVYGWFLVFTQRLWATYFYGKLQYYTRSVHVKVFEQRCSWLRSPGSASRLEHTVSGYVSAALV